MLGVTNFELSAQLLKLIYCINTANNNINSQDVFVSHNNIMTFIGSINRICLLNVE